VSAPRDLDAVVIGGGLAGVSAALDLTAAGASVTLLERRARLGGLTWSFEHAGRSIDNGQHVFLRCCTAYRGFLDRIGSGGDIHLQPRLEVTAVRPGSAGRPPVVGTLRRNGLPAPFHLGAALLRYRHLGWAERLAIGRAVLPLRRVDLDDPALDEETFGAWLGRHGQRPATIEALWDLITVATVNLPAAEASLAMGAMVFRTGLLSDAAAADIGWSLVPLGRLHGERAARALAAAGVDVRLRTRAGAVEPDARGRWSVTTDAGVVGAGAVVVAVPHHVAGDLLPPGSLPHQGRLGGLGASAIVNVHVVFDRPVTDLALLAGVGTSLQWVFDRTESSGLSGGGQYLAVSLSAADSLLGRRPADIATDVVAELGRVLPPAASARVVDTLVTKERAATFRAAPGAGRLRPGAQTAFAGLAVAGAWTDTGWPATMEGAVRSGQAAARAVIGSAAPDDRITEEVA
jgi:squalene-associated FAD-dependent desaturase